MEPDQLLSGRYHLRDRLGAGGMSVVFRAHDNVLDRDVAVKLLDNSVPLELRPRLRTEARAAGSLNHPAIATVYDYGEFDDKPYLVMELVDGESLAAWLHRDERIPWRRAVEMCADLADALASVHAKGLVHRDVKPANVIITERGAKLVDFGICAPAGADDGPDGQLVGTPAFVAPERIAGAPVGPAADVYALGLLCYWMVAGQLPWTPATADELLVAHLFQAPTPLVVDGFPADLAEAVMAALHKEPAHRPTAAAFAATLGKAPLATPGANPAGTPPPPQPTLVQSRMEAFHPTVAMSRVPAPGRGRRAVAIGAALFAGMALLGVVWAGHGSTPQAATAGGAGNPAPQCTARFSVDRDWGDGFDATVIVTEDARTLPDWTVAFTFPGSQTAVIRGDASVAGPSRLARAIHTTVRQSGSRVEAVGTGLPAGSTVTIPIRGTYDRSNPLPTSISLTDRECATSVAGATATPVPALTTNRDDRGSGGDDQGKDEGKGHGKGHGHSGKDG